VIEEAERRGLVLVSEPLFDVVQDSGGGYVVIDPVDIRLTFRAKPGLALAGRALRWCPLDGWSIARSQLDPPARYLAAPGATPLELVPTAANVIDWACAQPAGTVEPPVGVELDDDAAAIHRLLAFRPEAPGVAAPDLPSRTRHRDRRACGPHADRVSAGPCAHYLREPIMPLTPDEIVPWLVAAARRRPHVGPEPAPRLQPHSHGERDPL
jgi:hypothetical protein